MKSNAQARGNGSASTNENPGRAVTRVAGCDIGKATAKMVIGSLDEEGLLCVESVEAIAHEGAPFEAFAGWYRRADVASCAALGVTGLHACEIMDPAVSGLPEDACLQAAMGAVEGFSGPLNLVTVGARGYAVLTRSAAGHFQYLENDKCSSGTGETMVKIASRFGLSIQEADALACQASESIAITARCSVFAKSEMTHFGNQGKPADALFRGYFDAVATYANALLARARVDGPILLIGGASRLSALIAGLSRATGQEVLVPEEALGLEAIGAMILAAEQAQATQLEPLPSDPRALVRHKQRRFNVLEAASKHAHRVRRLPAPEVAEGAQQQPTILGLDLGSTGSKAVLSCLESGEAVLSLYDRTRGNPVQAAQRLIAELAGKEGVDVRAIGVTGSGREAVATVLRAAYQEQADRIVVVNEIVAHATAAIRCDDCDGESLSVVEIGGQDAKFIQIAGGQIVESDMNKACSAGTGSFLEEQAVFYGIDDIERFTELAQQAERPPDLGQMCTVFVADAAAEAEGEGFANTDVFGGFQYSVIHNYINRVMGQRSFGERIFFQGKPASGPALAWTLAAVSGREVIVPPDPGAMGAWGIGLCAREQIGPQLGAAPPLDLSVMLEARVVDRTELRCRDKDCDTLCIIDKTKVQVAGKRHTVLTGGACPKYEISSAARPKLPKQAPDAFAERKALLKPYLKPSAGDGPQVGVPLVGACYGYLPWLVTLLKELGLSPRVLASDKHSLQRGEERCYSFDACAPAKIAHGVLDAEIDTIFFPKLLSLDDRDGAGAATCPIQQALPEMVREALAARGRTVEIVHPILSLADGLQDVRLMLALRQAAKALGADASRLPTAMRKAAEAQRRYHWQLAAIGRRSLAYGSEHDIAAVAMVGSLHVIHERAVNASIPQLLRDSGVLAIPMDCIPIPAQVHSLERVGWGDARRALRVGVAAREQPGKVFPLMLTSFGCGPSSFAEQIFSALMEGYPHTVLESDGHGGAAGYVTRVQAFLHTAMRHDGTASPVSAERLKLLDPYVDTDIRQDSDAKLVLFGVGDHLSAVIAAAYRSQGLDAVAPPPNDARTLALGRSDCSGKECLPYQLIWGGFRRHLEERKDDKRRVLLQISGDDKCRNCMFPIKDQLSLKRLDMKANVSSRVFRAEPAFGWQMVVKAWSGMTLWDLLFQLACYYRPYEIRRGQVDALYSKLCEELVQLIAEPVGKGLKGVWRAARSKRNLQDFLGRASQSFAELERQATISDDKLRTVLLSGDIYVRVDPFASDDLVRRLNARGLRVLAEPTWMLSEYLAEERLSEILRLPTDLVANALTAGTMRIIRHEIYERASQQHPWLHAIEASELIEHASTLLDHHPQGEAPVTIGSVLHHWKARLCDGVVVASPWGCAPALIAESLLRHQREIPTFFVYADGSPMDDRRLNAFAFRLRRMAPRCVSAGGKADERATAGQRSQWTRAQAPLVSAPS